jgi:hypothetical protein
VNGYTALHWAVKRKHAHLVNFLIDCGGDPSIKDASGKTAIDLVCDPETAKIFGVQFDGLNEDINREFVPNYLKYPEIKSFNVVPHEHKDDRGISSTVDSGNVINSQATESINNIKDNIRTTLPTPDSSETCVSLKRKSDQDQYARSSHGTSSFEYDWRELLVYEAERKPSNLKGAVFVNGCDCESLGDTMARIRDELGIDIQHVYRHNSSVLVPIHEKQHGLKTMDLFRDDQHVLVYE